MYLNYEQKMSLSSMERKSFEEILKEFHAKQYIGTDDEMPDAFDSWLENLDMDTLFKIADIAIIEGEQRGIQEARKIINQSINERNH